MQRLLACEGPATSADALLLVTPELKRIRTMGVSDGHPVITRKFAQDPLSTKPPEPTVLLAAERARRRVVDSMVIYMRHSGLTSQRAPNTALPLPPQHPGPHPAPPLIPALH